MTRFRGVALVVLFASGSIFGALACSGGDPTEPHAESPPPSPTPPTGELDAATDPSVMSESECVPFEWAPGKTVCLMSKMPVEPYVWAMPTLNGADGGVPPDDLPPSIDHRTYLRGCLEPRDQGSRQWCVPFAIAAAHEAMHCEPGSELPGKTIVSIPHYWYTGHGKKDFDATEYRSGWSLYAAVDTMRAPDNYFLDESDWELHSDPIRTNQTRPPASVLEEDGTHGAAGYVPIAAKDAAWVRYEVKKRLASGHDVVAVVPVLTKQATADASVPASGWDEGPTEGYIDMGSAATYCPCTCDAAETDAGCKTCAPDVPYCRRGWHAILVVGYEDRPEANGGGVLRIRNSWGAVWGDESYGEMTYEYAAFHVIHFGSFSALRDRPRKYTSLVGTDDACARTPSNGVRCWSSGQRPVTIRDYEGPLSNVVAVGRGDGARIACAAKADGTLWCWGNNHDELVGPPPIVGDLYPNVAYPTGDVLSLADVKAVTTGKAHACAATPTGVYCWGYARFGELGDGRITATSPAMPVEVRTVSGAAIANVKSLVTGYQDPIASIPQPYRNSAFTCALDGAGTTQCWGGHYYGQLGDGYARKTAPYAVPNAVSVMVPGSFTRKAVAAGGILGCSIRSDGSVDCWGNAINTPGGGIGVAYDATGQSKAVSLATSSSIQEAGHTCFVLESGEAQCFGANYLGQLGNGTTTASNLPVSVSGLTDAKEIIVGSATSCALRKTGHIVCWGAGATTPRPL
jgi:alpha-tubulin suppressor-like RCC1 family protein